MGELADYDAMVAEADESRIVGRLRNYDACHEGIAYAKKLRARTPQEVWDRCTKPHFMLWWIDQMADQYKKGVTPLDRQISLAVAFCRLNLDASEGYYTIVNEVAESNAALGEDGVQGYPSFVIAEHLEARDGAPLSEDGLTYQETVALRSLIQVEEGGGLFSVYNTTVCDGIRGSGEAACRLIREFFPEVPVPTLEQEDEWLEGKENVEYEEYEEDTYYQEGSDVDY